MIIESKNLVIGIILLVCFWADHRKHLLFQMDVIVIVIIIMR